jgi:septum formation protein
MVYFKKLGREEIKAYVRTKEPLDKAGAYAVQGLGAVFIEKINGDFFNVMGLPLCVLTESLKKFGIYVLK